MLLLHVSLGRTESRRIIVTNLELFQELCVNDGCCHLLFREGGHVADSAVKEPRSVIKEGWVGECSQINKVLQDFRGPCSSVSALRTSPRRR